MTDGDEWLLVNDGQSVSDLMMVDDAIYFAALPHFQQSTRRY